MSRAAHGFQTKGGKPRVSNSHIWHPESPLEGLHTVHAGVQRCRLYMWNYCSHISEIGGKCEQSMKIANQFKNRIDFKCLSMTCNQAAEEYLEKWKNADQSSQKMETHVCKAEEFSDCTHTQMMQIVSCRVETVRKRRCLSSKAHVPSSLHGVKEMNVSLTEGPLPLYREEKGCQGNVAGNAA